MLTELDILKLVCVRLEHADIPYMLTGSFAANFYTVPRMTRDIDIVLEIFKPDANKLFQVFQHDCYISKESISDAIEHQSMFNIIHEKSVLKIDFIIRKNVTYRNAEFQRRRQVPFQDTHIWIVSPEDLIISKLFWAKDSLSRMQLRDVHNILSNVKHLDHAYIHDWVHKLELVDIYKMVQVNE